MANIPAPSALRSCPFCQGAGGLVVAEPKRRFVECAKCGAGSEPAETDALAIANWSKRVRAFEARPSAWFTKPQDGAIAA